MPKIKPGHLAPLELSILLALDYLERRNGVGGLFSGKAIARIIGGAWSDHRHEAAARLAGDGWLIIQTMPYDLSGKRFYALTDAARNDLEMRFAVARGEFIPSSESYENEETE